jgi:predicted component of type VI protein secretion system
MPSPEKSFVEDGAVWGRLELSMTPGESTIYELRGNQSQVMGRASGCDLRVDLPHISGSHCTVRPSGTSEDGQYCAKIRDISSNGTVVNGVAIGKEMS